MLFSLTAVALAADLTVGPLGTYQTLEDALDAASDGDRLLVEPGTYLPPVLNIDARAITVEGTAPGVRIESSAARRAFTIDGGSLTLVTLEVDGLDDVGLAEVRGGSLSLQSVTVTNARAPNPGQPGGSIDAEDAVITVLDSVLDGAVAPVKNGGHVFALRSDITIERSTLRNGSADMGAGVYVDAGSLTILDSTFELNAADSGSAVEAIDALVAVEDSRFLNNVASVGDTFSCTGGTSCSFSATHFEGNQAAGSAVLATENVGSVTVSDLVACRMTGAGALMQVVSGSLSMTRSVVTNVSTTGSAIVVAADASGSFVHNSMVLNQPGASLLSSDGPLVLTNNLIASTAGPAVAVAARGGLSGGYNFYAANAGGDVEPAPLATDLIGGNPGLGAVLPDSCDLTAFVPGKGSPLIDAGDPSLLDADLSPSDIGAFDGQSPNPPEPPEDLDGDGFDNTVDCDDANLSVYPGALEVQCNGIDDDCDALTADNIDADGDGVGQCDNDCDDSNADFFEMVELYLDQDFDGYGVGEPTAFCVTPNNSALVAGDCDDKDPDSFPGAIDVPYDGIDQDCDGADLDDLDGDGALGAVDCDDSDAGRFPGAKEVPDDGIDQDCTGFDVASTYNGGAGWTCGCATGAPMGWLGLWGAVGLGLVRRRRP